MWPGREGLAGGAEGESPPPHAPPFTPKLSGPCPTPPSQAWVLKERWELVASLVRLLPQQPGWGLGGDDTETRERLRGRGPRQAAWRLIDGGVWARKHQRPRVKMKEARAHQYRAGQAGGAWGLTTPRCAPALTWPAPATKSPAGLHQGEDVQPEPGRGNRGQGTQRGERDSQRGKRQ